MLQKLAFQKKSLIALAIATSIALPSLAADTYFLVTQPLARQGANSNPGSGTQNPQNPSQPAAPGELVVTGNTAFGDVQLGQLVQTQLTVKNIGGSPLPVTSEARNADISIDTSDCGATLAAGDSCTALLIWTPSASGTMAETVDIAGTQITLSGYVPAPASLSGGSTQEFGEVTVGNSASKTWTLTNSGDLSASLNYSGSLPAGMVKTGTCGDSLAGGQSCTVVLTWTPTASDTLASTSYTVSGQNLTFSGTAKAPAPTVSTLSAYTSADTIDTGEQETYAHYYSLNLTVALVNDTVTSITATNGVTVSKVNNTQFIAKSGARVFLAEVTFTAKTEKGQTLTFKTSSPAVFGYDVSHAPYILDYNTPLVVVN